MELETVEQNALMLAESAANDESQVVEGARQMLMVIGNFILTTGLEPDACTGFCTDLRKQFTRYANIGAIRPDGRVFCSAVAARQRVDASDQSWFKRALASREVIISSFHRGRITGKPVVIMARPLFGPRGETTAILFCAIDIRWMNRRTAGLTSRLPVGAVLNQIDADGVMVSYHADTHSWQRGSLVDPAVIRSIVSKGRGVIEAPDARGRPSIHSFAPLRSALKNQDVVMVLTIPRHVVFTHSKRMLIRNLTLLAGVSIVALILARLAGKYFVLRQVGALAEASRKLAAGDLSTRLGPLHIKGELGQLARDFDEMAAALETQVNKQKKTEGELRESREQLRNLTAHIEIVREEERTRIAREIHDNLGQALTALKMDVSWLEKKASEPTSRLVNKIQSMNALIEETIRTVQRISAELRPGILDDFGLPAAIEWQTGEFQERTGITATLHLPENFGNVPKDQSTALFRIYQEALTNVIRHANASAVEVTLEETEGRLSLTVADNGRGISEADATHPKSFGLIGMQERVHPWGGSVRIHGIPNQGTAITVTIPLEKKETHRD